MGWSRPTAADLIAEGLEWRGVDDALLVPAAKRDVACFDKIATGDAVPRVPKSTALSDTSKP